MAVSEYHLDTRIRRRHIPLVTQQRHLRHLRSLSARNVTVFDADICSEPALAFTLHVRPDSPAFYTSEIIPESLNPSWKDFESRNFPENVDTASTYVSVKIWNLVGEKQLVIEWLVFFSGLVFIGEQVPKEGKNFKPNSIIFGMSEGYYGCDDCYQHAIGNTVNTTELKTLTADLAGLRTSYSLNTLSRIKTVERAIKQTQAAVQRRRNSINNRLQSEQELHQLHAQRELLRIKISVLKSELQSQQKIAHSLEKEISSYKNDLVKKKNEINSKSEEQKKLVERCVEISKCYCEFRENLLKTEAQLNFRRKQLISELNYIYPVVEFPDHKGFSIHEVHLPNSENFSGHDETMIAIALGYVCHIVLMISQFLNVPLRYSIQFYGSRSSIMDHISSSLPEKTREFPLYSKGKDRRCFEYGVFLLNKNIAQVRILSGLTTRDLSATLPNLSSLIELRLSVNSEPYGMLHNTGFSYKVRNLEAKITVSTDKPPQNGFSKFSDRVAGTPPPHQMKVSDSEIEFLKREMEAMMPDSAASVHNTLQLFPKSKDNSNALSCSLDKGLNDIKLLEKSLETLNGDEKQLPSKSSTQVTFLKQTYHHSSYPNLNSSLRMPDGYSVSPQLLATPPKIWTADNSRTNSEEEHTEDELKTDHQSAVLNDSIFYIPTQLVHEGSQASSSVCDNVSTDQPEKAEISAIRDDFTADLSMRTEQLANRKSSFQMQRLHSSSTDEEHLSRI